MQTNFKSVLELLKSVLKDGINSNQAVIPEPVVALKKTLSIIGANVELNGKMLSDQDLIIHGRVRGAIMAKSSDITVGVDGQLDAQIVAKRIKIEGAVIGDIVGGEKVIIGKTGNVVGNIQAPIVNLEDGAKFKGCIEMDPQILDIHESQQNEALEPTDKTINGQQTT